MKRFDTNKKIGANECRMASIEDNNDNNESNGVICGELDEQSNDSHNSLVAQIKADLECPVCLDSIGPKVLQCKNGHLFCQKCDQKLNGNKSCPTCRVDITDSIRNLFAEKLAVNLSFDCKYSLDGCCVRLKFADKTEHEEVCPFRPYTCPYPHCFGCQWIGHLEQIIPHLSTHHSLTTDNSCDIRICYTDLSQSGKLIWKTILSCYSHHFLVTLAKDNDDTQTQLNQYQMYVQFVGDTNEAKKFAYELVMSGNERSLKWQSSMDSIRVTSADMRQNSLNFDNKTVKLFNDSNGRLYVHVKIIRK